MPSSCAVSSCNSRFSKTKGKGIIYHCFPSGNDPESMKICREWVRRCKRTNKFNPSTSKICSLHFEEYDYERDLQHELLNLPIRKRLKKTALPSLHLPPLQSEEQDQVYNVEELTIEIVDDESEDDIENTSNIWKEKYNELLVSYEELQYDIAKMEIQHRNEVKDLKLKIKNYENLLTKLKTNSTSSCSVLF